MCGKEDEGDIDSDLDDEEWTTTLGHGAMSGTNFKKNQKSKTPYLMHYKLCHLKEWLSSMERFDLDHYHIGKVSSSITIGCIFFFRNIFTDFFLLSYLHIYAPKILHYHLRIYKHQKVYI